MAYPDQVSLFRQMLLIRRFEDKAAEMYAYGKIRGFLHLYTGEEAIAVGAQAALPDADLFVSYRDHGYALVRGILPREVMAELCGKATGICQGRGGSMHLADVNRHFWGGYAIVAGHIPLAVGMAFAHHLQGVDRPVLCVFGDGATNAGDFHEAMNMAKIWKLPIIFLCENNLYAMGTATRLASAQAEMYKKACSYNIQSWQVDGMDVLAVYDSIKEAANCLKREGPVFVEAVTYRFRGHSMADPETYRDKAEVEVWKKRDPIVTFRRRLIDEGILTAEKADEIEAETQSIIEDAVRFADESPEPALDTLYQYVY